jgi:hypothetical protein
MTRFFS